MYGYEPVDGMIDDELVSQLEEVLAEKQPSVATETEEVDTQSETRMDSEQETETTSEE